MSKTALLIMDVLVANVSRNTLPPAYLPLMASTIAAARASSVKIIYVTISFRPGYPEITPFHPTFSAAAKANAFLSGSPEVKVHSAIAPQAGDIVVVKKRVSAFVGSDLEVILRSLGVQTLVLTGISTGGVVLSTLCEAADKDFGLVVLRDLCVDPKEEVHRVLMENIFTKRGKVVGAEEWLEALKAEA
jgi:nicotinamidase-related amidase